MSNRASAAVSLLLGFGLLAGAGFFGASARKRIATAQRAPGAVVDFQRRSSKSGSARYPVIEFTTAAGEVHRFTTSGAGDYAKGEAVEVLYDPGDPSNAKVDVFIELWLGTLALGGFGLLCLGIGVGTLLYDRARAKART
jgi:hypothetical protein